VRHDARARLQLGAESRHQPRDETRKQVQHHHARFLDVGLKEIALHEFDAIGDAFALRAGSRQVDELGLELDADPRAPNAWPP